MQKHGTLVKVSEVARHSTKGGTKTAENGSGPRRVPGEEDTKCPELKTFSLFAQSITKK